MKQKTYTFLLLLIYLLLPLINLHAQLPDTIRLKPVEVMGSRALVFTGGVTTLLHDSSTNNPFQNQSLAGLLETNSAVFIKSYGSGGSATISSRGTEARHTSVLWNGFNINSSSLGLSDVSMIPSFLTDNIILYNGGSSPVNGNAAIGATVVFENLNPLFNPINSFAFNAEGGSFGNTHFTFNSKICSRFIESKTTIFYDRAENNFKYRNIAKRNNPVTEQSHATYLNYGLAQDFQFKINDQQYISAGLWYQSTERELPALMTTPESYANQRDSTWRTYIGYKYRMKKSVLSAKGAYFREFQYYDDDKYDIHAAYLVNNYFAEGELRVFINDKLILNTGITLNEGNGNFEEYSGKKSRSTTAIFSSLKYQVNQRLQLNFNLRKEFSNIATPPLSPSIGAEVMLIKNYLTCLAKAGRNFSLPSMNDLFWVPGGNPDLKPENAWSEEFSLLFFKGHKFLPGISITAFNSLVDNWIKWQPSAGGIYAPDNLRQVHSRGIESSLDYKRSLNKWHFIAGMHYTWCRSTVTKATVASENATIGKQLIYVPEHVFNFTAAIKWNSYSIHFSSTRTGNRYTSSDNTTLLEGYTISNLSIEKGFINLPLPFSVYVKVLNLFDSTYQVLAYRPTPGRWYSAGIKVNFTHSNKNSKK